MNLSDLNETNFNENIDQRIEELRKRYEYFKLNSKYLEINEVKIKDKKTELENMQIRLEEEERENFHKYQVIYCCIFLCKFRTY